MHGDSFVILLIVFGMFMVMRRRGFGPFGRLQEQIEELRTQQQQQQIAPQRGPTVEQMQMLEDRVRVLERIVTDQNYGLAREIEALRDPRETGEKI
jgi:hypothetical protein